MGGYVVEVNDEGFIARLSDVMKGQKENEDTEVEIPKEEVDPAHLYKLREGAVFRWVISYVSEPGKNRYRSSVLIFRQLPRKESTLPRGVKEIFDGIDWE